MNPDCLQGVSDANRQLKNECDQSYDRWKSCGKTEINELCFQLLPGRTTIAELEEIACEIFKLINDEWEK